MRLLIILSLNLATLFSALSLAAEKSETAVATASRFLDQIQRGVPAGTLIDETALSPHTVPKVKQTIINSLERFSRKIRSIDAVASIQEISYCPKHPDWAIVQCFFQGRLDIRDNEVFFLCLKRNPKKRGWIVGPSIGSFAHMPKGYHPVLRKALDDFQLTAIDRNRQLASTIQDKAVQNFQDDMERAVPANTLKSLSPQELFFRFIDACREKNYPAVLAYLGAHEKVLPENFDEISRAAKIGLSGKDQRMQWELLTGKQHLWVNLAQDIEDASGILTVRCYSPFIPHRQRPFDLRPRYDLSSYNIEIFKERNAWRVFLPSNFLYSDAPLSTYYRHVTNHEHDLPPQLNKKIGQKIQAQNETIHSITPEGLCHEIAHAFQHQDFRHFIRLVGVSPEMNDSELKTVYDRLRDFWKDSMAGQRIEIMGWEATLDVGSMSLHLPDQTSRSFIPLFLVRSDKGWTIHPGIDRPTEFEKHFKSIASELQKAQAHYKKLKSRLMKEGQFLKGYQLENWNPQRDISAEALNEDALQELAENFFIAAAKGDQKTASQHSLSLAKLDFESPTVFQNSYFEALDDLKTPTPSSIPDRQFLKIHRQKSLTAISFRLKGKTPETDQLIISLVQASENGQLCLLPETILYPENSRRNELLNHFTWKRIRQNMEGDLLKSYQALHQKFSQQ